MQYDHNWDNEWDKVHREREWGSCPEPMMARFVKRRLKVGSRVLDIGCAAGAQSFWLYDNGYTAYGIDASPAAIARAVGRQEARGIKGIRFRVHDLRNQVQDGYFDGVIDVCCLQHISWAELPRVLKNLKEVMRAGAWLFSMTATDNHTDDKSVGILRKCSGVEQVIAPLQEAGFREFSVGLHRTTDGESVAEHFVTECRNIGV